MPRVPPSFPSFPNGACERTCPKLRFGLPRRRETAFPGPAFPNGTTFCKGARKARGGKEFASMLHSQRRANPQESSHGTRTLAPFVPPAARCRQGLLPEV